MHDPNLAIVGIIGSSFTRRSDLVKNIWSVIHEKSERVGLCGGVVDPAPLVHGKPSVDLDIRSRVLMWQEQGMAADVFERMMNEGSSGVLFCPYTAWSFMVESVMLNHEIANEARKNSSVILGADGQPQFTSPEAQMKIQESNYVAHNSASIQRLAMEVYDGFFTHLFFLESEEEPAGTVPVIGVDNAPPMPVGTREQLRHHHFNRLVDVFGFPVIRLDSNVETATALASEVLIDHLGIGGGEISASEETDEEERTEEA